MIRQKSAEQALPADGGIAIGGKSKGGVLPTCFKVVAFLFEGREGAKIQSLDGRAHGCFQAIGVEVAPQVVDDARLQLELQRDAVKHLADLAHGDRIARRQLVEVLLDQAKFVKTEHGRIEGAAPNPRCFEGDAVGAERKGSCRKLYALLRLRAHLKLPWNRNRLETGQFPSWQQSVQGQMGHRPGVGQLDVVVIIDLITRPRLPIQQLIVCSPSLPWRKLVEAIEGIAQARTQLQLPPGGLIAEVGQPLHKAALLPIRRPDAIIRRLAVFGRKQLLLAEQLLLQVAQARFEGAHLARKLEKQVADEFRLLLWHQLLEVVCRSASAHEKMAVSQALVFKRVEQFALILAIQQVELQSALLR